jgi:hypothetical protein
MFTECSWSVLEVMSKLFTDRERESQRGQEQVRPDLWIQTRSDGLMVRSTGIETTVDNVLLLLG